MRNLIERILTAVGLLLFFISVVTGFFAFFLLAFWALWVMGHFLGGCYRYQQTGNWPDNRVRSFRQMVVVFTIGIVVLLLDAYWAVLLNVSVHYSVYALSDILYHPFDSLHELFAFETAVIALVWMVFSDGIYRFLSSHSPLNRLYVYGLSALVMFVTLFFGYSILQMLFDVQTFIQLPRIDSYYWLMFVVSAILAVIVSEWYRLIQSKTSSAEASAVAHQKSARAGMMIATVLFLVLVLLNTVLETLANRPESAVLLASAARWIFLGVLCVATVLWLWAFVRLFQHSSNASSQWQKTTHLVLMVFAVFAAYFAIRVLYGNGWTSFLSVLGLVWVADIGAFFCGKSFGKHKLAVHISPGKTWEGAIGAVCLCIAYAAVLLSVEGSYFAGLREYYGVVATMIWTVLLVAVSILGDLMESQLKRSAYIKDSSQLLPGHGGFFDRMDALLPVLCIAVLPLYPAAFHLWASNAL